MKTPEQMAEELLARDCNQTMGQWYGRHDITEATDMLTAWLAEHEAEVVERCVEGACQWYIFDNPSKPRDADLLRSAIREAAGRKE